MTEPEKVEREELVGIKYSKGPGNTEIQSVSDFTVTLGYEEEATSIEETDNGVEWVDHSGFTHVIPEKYVFEKIFMRETEK